MIREELLIGVLGDYVRVKVYLNKLVVNEVNINNSDSVIMLRTKFTTLLVGVELIGESFIKLGKYKMSDEGKCSNM